VCFCYLGFKSLLNKLTVLVRLVLLLTSESNGSVHLLHQQHQHQYITNQQIMVDPDLKQYEVIICDEVHERHLTGDFMLGLLRAVLRRNDQLRVVLMSATINSQLFRCTTITVTLILVNY
jgi:hypothetical protein